MVRTCVAVARRPQNVPARFQIVDRKPAISVRVCRVGLHSTARRQACRRDLSRPYRLTANCIYDRARHSASLTVRWIGSVRSRLREVRPGLQPRQFDGFECSFRMLF
jgi:hypothetical protein